MLTLLVQFTACLWVAQVPPADLSFEEYQLQYVAERAESEAARLARERPIKEEIARLGEDHPWAGEYYVPFGGCIPDFQSLILAPNSGCVWRRENFPGSPVAVDEWKGGKVIEKEDGTLALVCDASDGEWFRGGQTVELIPVQLGKRHYLVKPTEMDLFRVWARKTEPITTNGWNPDPFILRIGDESKTWGRDEETSPKWRRQIGLNPIVGSIIAASEPTTELQNVGKTLIRITRVTIDRGAEFGVVRGMGFRVCDPFSGHSLGIAYPREVTADKTIAEFTQLANREPAYSLVGFIVLTGTGTSCEPLYGPEDPRN